MRQLSVGAALAAVITLAPAFGQAATLADLAGTWAGSLNAPNGAQAPLVVHVMADGTGSVDSPAQDVYGVPAEDFEVEHNMVSFTVPRIDVRFHGMLEGDLAAIDGQWMEKAKSLPLRLVRREETPAP